MKVMKIITQYDIGFYITVMSLFLYNAYTFYAEHSFSKNYEITYVTTAINLGREDHGVQGSQSGRYKFEHDYLARLIGILKLKWPLSIYIQKKYLPYIASHLHDKVDVNFFELEELEHDNNFQKITELRPMLGSCPGHVKNNKYYTALVIKKMEFLYKTAQKNPFKTNYFVWIDANYFAKKFKARNHSILISDLHKFIVMRHLVPETVDTVWGMPRSIFTSYCEQPIENQIFCVAGGLFGGTIKSIEVVYELYTHFLQHMLANNNLGTDENLFSFCYHKRPEIFNCKPSYQYYDILST